MARVEEAKHERIGSSNVSSLSSRVSNLRQLMEQRDVKAMEETNVLNGDRPPTKSEFPSRSVTPIEGETKTVTLSEFGLGNGSGYSPAYPVRSTTLDEEGKPTQIPRIARQGSS